jgi:uncharacterized protein
VDQAHAGAATPTSESERAEFLDVLRGVSLLGIVLANMISYSLYLYLPPAARSSLSTAPIDPTLDFLELVLIEGKFYTIFSVLFGVGFAMLSSHTEAKGLRFGRFFRRRAALLASIGLVHAALFWHNDILHRQTLSRWFAPVGRMALTNYVGQSVIALLIFRGVGLGLGGTIGPALHLPLGALIYAAQLAASGFWLARFQFGPLEWLWRMLTYGRWLALRKPAAARGSAV